MGRIAAVAFAATLVASVAAAQYKVPAQPRVTATTPNQSPSQPSPIKIEMANPAPQMSAEPSLESAKRISLENAVKLVKQRKAVWVDVRTKESFDAGHIKGALSIPLSELPGRLGELPRNKEIITYCA